jgi:uncharacterized ParB-like nuclease family protein
MRDCGPLLELSDVSARLGLAGRSDGGFQTIPIDAIVGTVDRCCDFDRCFHAQRGDLPKRVAAIARVFPDGALPPIDVVQVDRAYFVADGHKRVAAARGRGDATIDAHVIRMPSPVAVDGTLGHSDLARLQAERRLLREIERRLPCRSPAACAEIDALVAAHRRDHSPRAGELRRRSSWRPGWRRAG